MMNGILRLMATGVVTTLLALALLAPTAAYEPSAVLLEFNPEEDTSTRYMFQLVLSGAQVSPGFKDQIEIGEYMIGTVYKDEVTEALMGLTRHRLTFYEYNALASNALGTDRTDPRFGGNDFPELPREDNGGGDGGDGDGDGGGGGGPGPAGNRSFLQGLNLPSAPQGAPQSGLGNGMPPLKQGPMQNDGDGNGGNGDGGNGGFSGQMNSAIGLDTIRVTNLDYVKNHRGEVLDVSGLDLLRKVSENKLVQEDESERNYIDINISHLFEWANLLYVPDYPVYKDDIWFHSFPLHVPGLPYDRPIMTKFLYQLKDFRTVGTRKLCVIDMSGVCEWNMDWETRSKEQLTEFKSWGQMGIATRYWFDYENKVLFGMERPPFFDYQYQRDYGAQNLFIPYGATGNLFGMRYPGQSVLLEFFYNTRVTDISGKPRLTEVKPKEQRRYINLFIFNQLEAE